MRCIEKVLWNFLVSCALIPKIELGHMWWQQIIVTEMFFYLGK